MASDGAVPKQAGWNAFKQGPLHTSSSAAQPESTCTLSNSCRLCLDAVIACMQAVDYSHEAIPCLQPRVGGVVKVSGSCRK